VVTAGAVSEAKLEMADRGHSAPCPRWSNVVVDL
jgi:hypothetical protein